MGETDESGRMALTYPGGRVVVVDSVSLLKPEDAGAVVVGGSHCARQAVAYALRSQPAALFLNDAGKGLDGAGISGLPLLDEAGVPGAAVDCMTARIGDGASTYATGRLSVVNETARRLGLREGMAVQQAVGLLIGGKTW